MPGSQPPQRPHPGPAPELPVHPASSATGGTDWRPAFALLAARHEAQRHQAARTVHDRIAQALAAMRMSAQLCLDEDDLAQVRRDLAELIAAADQAMRETRALERELRPPQLDSLGLVGALQAELEHALGGETGRQAELEAVALPNDGPGPLASLACIRILQGWLEAVLEDDDSIAVRVRVLPSQDDSDCRVQMRCESAGPGPRPGPGAWLLWQALAASCDGFVSVGEIDAGETRWRHGIELILPCPGAEPFAVEGEPEVRP